MALFFVSLFSQIDLLTLLRSYTLGKHILWHVQVILADNTTVHGEWTVKAPDTRGKVFQKKLAAAQLAQGYKYPDPPADSGAWYRGSDGEPVAILWQTFGSPWHSYDMPNYGKHVALYRVAIKKVEGQQKTQPF